MSVVFLEGVGGGKLSSAALNKREAAGQAREPGCSFGSQIGKVPVLKMK